MDFVCWPDQPPGCDGPICDQTASAHDSSLSIENTVIGMPPRHAAALTDRTQPERDTVARQSVEPLARPGSGGAELGPLQGMEDDHDPRTHRLAVLVALLLEMVLDGSPGRGSSP